MTVIIDKSNSITELETLISGLTVATETTSNLVLILKTASLSGVDSSSIKTELLSRISSANTSSSIEEITLLSASLPLISENRSISVADMTELNSLDVEAGTVVFVDSINVPYVRKSNSTWALLFPDLQGGSKPNAYAWGNNVYGQIGDGSTVSKSSPVSIIGGFTDWVQLSGGTTHSLGVRADGTAWAWGRNAYGQLGDNTITSKSSPVSVIGGFTNWIQVDCGGFHSLGLRANGTAWAWGYNGGVIGDGTTTSRRSPVSVVGGFTDWIQLSAGTGHSLGVRANGTAWGWGFGNFGKIGDGTTAARTSPVSVATAGGVANWVQVSGGDGHSLGIRTDGTAWAWGRNSFGVLGTGNTTNFSSPTLVAGSFTDWTQVSAGYQHSLGIRANGTAWAWGNNAYGRLGDGTTTNSSSPVSIVGGFTDWVQVSAGRTSNIAIKSNGTAWGWGQNSYGEIGDGTNTSALSPVSVIGGFADWIQVSVGVYPHSLGVRTG